MWPEDPTHRELWGSHCWLDPPSDRSSNWQSKCYVFWETSPTFPLAAVGLCQGPQQGHSWDLSEGPEGRDCHTSTPVRSPLVPGWEAGNRKAVRELLGRQWALVGTQFCQQSFWAPIVPATLLRAQKLLRPSPALKDPAHDLTSQSGTRLPWNKSVCDVCRQEQSAVEGWRKEGLSLSEWIREDQEAGPGRDASWSGRSPETQSEIKLRVSTQEMGKMVALRTEWSNWRVGFREGNSVGWSLALEDSRADLEIWRSRREVYVTGWAQGSEG